MRYIIWTFGVLSLAIMLGTCSTKNTLKNEDLGSILVKSNIPRAEIFLDNVSTGKFTPDTLFDVPVGYHQVRIEKFGFSPDPSNYILQVQAGILDSIVFVLNKLYYSVLQVTSDPPGAAIVFDQKSIKEYTPVTLLSIPAGIHIVSVYKNMYSTDLPGKEVVNLIQNDTTELSFHLTYGDLGTKPGNISPYFYLQDDFGDTISLYNYRGFVLILNFWESG